MKKGEKYIIEIDDVMTAHNKEGKEYQLARIKGFSSLVMDAHGLSMLKKVEEPKEEPQEKFLNCWFVVTKIENTYGNYKYVEVGNKYHVVDGFFVASKNTTFPLYDERRLKTQDQLIDYMLNDFACVEIAILEGYDDAST